MSGYLEVGKRVVVCDRRPTGIDLATVAEAAAERSAAILRRAGIQPRLSWPIQPANPRVKETTQ